MDNIVEVGDHFSYDFGDETYSFPVETIIIHIDEEIAIVKVISITAECEDMTLEYDEVKEYFPDFTDPERDSNSRYLFLDMETLDLFDDPYSYYYMEELDDESSEGSKDINENAEGHSAASDTISDDLPF